MSSKAKAKPKSKDIAVGDNDAGNESELTRLRQRMEEQVQQHMRVKAEFDALKLLNEEMTLRHDKEIKELKLDLRIAKKDADKHQDTNRYLRDEKKDLRAELAQLKTSIEEHSQLVKEKDRLISQLEGQKKALDMDLNAKQLEQQALKDSYEHKVQGLADEAKALRERLNTELKWKRKYEESKGMTEQNSNEMQFLRNQLQSIQTELNSKTNELKQKDREIQKLNAKNKVLKEECQKIEGQAEQFKTRFVGLGAQKEKLMADKNCTVTEVQKLNKELESIRNNLKSVLKDKEEAYRRLESEQSEYQSMVEREKQRLISLEEALQREVQKNREYEERLSVQEQNLYTNDETIVSLDSKVSHLEEELIAIKEEAAKHITAITCLKDTNHKLSIAFQDSLDKVEELQERIDSLHHQMELKEEEFNRERITAHETSGQQLKLIDFLQNKVQTLEKQKKPLFSITPTKTKFVTNSTRAESVCPLELKDLDRALAEEKTKNRRLVEELNRIKVEANDYKSEVFRLKDSINTDDLILNHESNKRHRKPLFCDHKNRVNSRHYTDSQMQSKSSDTYKSGSERMHHNIPHRFGEILNKMPNNKCVSCAQTIHFGFKAMKCSECNATTHQKCAQRLPNNCGLPVQLMQQLFHSSHDINSEDNFEYFSESERGVIEVHPLEPSAPEESFIKSADNSDSSATTDNNESDSGAIMSSALESQLETPLEAEIREIEDILGDKENENFSFTDSMIEALEREDK